MIVVDTALQARTAITQELIKAAANLTGAVGVHPDVRRAAEHFLISQFNNMPPIFPIVPKSGG